MSTTVVESVEQLKSQKSVVSHSGVSKMSVSFTVVKVTLDLF